MQALDIGFVVIMGVLAAIDFRTLRVPFWGLAVVTVLAFGRYFFDIDALIVNMALGLLLMIVSVLVGDKIIGSETMGGGDVWLGVAMSAFMGFDRFLMAYIFAALLGMTAFMTIHRNLRNIDIAYVPYLAAGSAIAMVVK